MSGHEPPRREAASPLGGPPAPADSATMAGLGRELARLPGGCGPIEIVEAELVDDEPGAATVAPPKGLPAADGYTPAGVPTLDHVRQRIAAGLAEQEAPGQRAPEAGEAARQAALRLAAEEKLASLRKDLAKPSGD